MPKTLTLAQELEKAAGLKKARTESRPEYLRRLITAVSNLPDADWTGLSADAKKWYDGNVTRIDAKEEPEDFPAAAEPVARRAPTTVAAEATAEVAAEAPPPPSKRKAAVKKAAKPKAAKPKAAVKKAAKPKAAAKVAVKKAATAAATNGAEPAKVGKGRTNGGSSLIAIRKAIIGKPNITEGELFDRLTKKFPGLKLSTISTTRAGVRAVMKLLPEYSDKFNT